MRKRKKCSQLVPLRAIKRLLQVEGYQYLQNDNRGCETLQKGKKRTVLEMVADPDTVHMLLPEAMERRDNARQMRHYKKALRQGFRNCLSAAQRENMQMYYAGNLRKSDIAQQKGCTCSAVSKSIKAGEKALRAYIEMYMNIYATLEQEFLRDEW